MRVSQQARALWRAHGLHCHVFSERGWKIWRESEVLQGFIEELGNWKIMKPGTWKRKRYLILFFKTAVNRFHIIGANKRLWIFRFQKWRITNRKKRERKERGVSLKKRTEKRILWARKGCSVNWYLFSDSEKGTCESLASLYNFAYKLQEGKQLSVGWSLLWKPSFLQQDECSPQAIFENCPESLLSMNPWE